MTKPRDSVRFFAVDGGIARLLRCSRVQAGRLHVEELDTLHDRAAEHEHGRPSPRVGKDGSSYASPGHEEEHRLHRFAKEVAAWIEVKADSDPEEIVVFAPPRFLGELRKLYAPALASRIRELQADLTRIPAGSLARHAAVAELMD